jgi:hypothetical protein
MPAGRCAFAANPRVILQMSATKLFVQGLTANLTGPTTPQSTPHSDQT